MPKKKILTGAGIAATAAVFFILGSLGLMPVFAQSSPSTNVPQAVVQNVDDDDAAEALAEGPDTDAVEEQVGDQSELDEQQPQYAGSIQIDDSQYEGMSEADEAAALQTKATITSAQVEAAALAANPGATVVKTELDNENGALVYSVELNNGLEVKVDAGNGTILHTEQANVDQEGTEAEDALGE